MRIGHSHNDEEILLTAVQNPDKSIVVVILNQSEEAKSFHLDLKGKKTEFAISGNALQTVLIPANS
jgi:glucosylceramidase